MHSLINFRHSLQWCHNERDDVSNHMRDNCLPKRLFGRRSKKTSQLRVTGLCEGNSPWLVIYLHRGPVTRKRFPIDDVIMYEDRAWMGNYTSWGHGMMTSSNGNILRVTGPLCGEFTGPRWISHTNASDAELWCFLWSASEWTVE